jgi:hypothetical protein
MRALFLSILISFMSIRAIAGSIPAQITYQGTLKEKGVPAQGFKTMFFRITNDDGRLVYWSSGDLKVNVMQGLFSVPLTPTGIDWQNVSPYIEVSIEGQTMNTREPLSTTIYAAISASIIDGAVSTPKLADASVTKQKIDPVSFEVAGVGLVPVGAILMFDKACPPGWARYVLLDNNFAMGMDPSVVPPKTPGGFSTHHHSISADGSHAHSLISDATAVAGKGGTSNIGWTDANGALFGFNPGTGSETWYQADRNTTPAGGHNHGGTTGDSSSLPPYISLVFCQKQ